jgi:hypothetical protein
MFLEVAAVKQAHLREQQAGHEGHLGELLQAALDAELVPFLLGHERHDDANMRPAARAPVAPPRYTALALARDTSLHMCVATTHV